MSVARHIFNAAGEKGADSLEPVVLGDGALSADHARHLVQQAIHGAPFTIDDLGRVEVLFDQRRSYAQAMLAPDRVEESSDRLLLGNGTPLCVRHSTRVGVVLESGNRDAGDHVPAIIGLAQDQLDVVFCGPPPPRLGICQGLRPVRQTCHALTKVTAEAGRFSQAKSKENVNAAGGE